MKIEFCWRLDFEILIIQKPSLGVTWGPTKNVGPIGSVVFTFIEYKQTGGQEKHTYKYTSCKMKELLLNCNDSLTLF